MPNHRHFGFTASSPPPCDEDREGAADALPAAHRSRSSSRGMESAPAVWPRYVLDPGASGLRCEPATSSRQISAAEEAIAVSSRMRHRADRCETFWIIGILVAAFALLLIAPAIVS